MGLFSNSFREEDNYLLLNQPKPSKAVLSNDTYLKYTRSPCASSDCFDWVQPLRFTVNETRTQWNELSLKSQSFTEVLKNIKNSNCLTCSVDVADECFCFDPVTVECASEDTCNPFKYSLTASNIKSDINLYTDFWEKATNVYYYAQNDFTLSATLVGAYDESQVLDTSYTTNDLAARNLGNDNFTSTIAWFVNKDELVPGSDLGFFKPDVFGMSKWESTVTGDGLSSVNNTLPYSGGILKKDNKQYRDIFDINGKKYDLCGYGYNNVCAFEPFSRVDKEVNLRNGCEAEYETLTDGVQTTQQDIYGNSYFLIKPNTDILDDVVSGDIATGTVLINCVGGQRRTLSEILSDDFYLDGGVTLHVDIDYIASSQVARIAIYYDVLVVYTASGFVSIFQIQMDYESGIPYILPQDAKYTDTICRLPMVRHFFDSDSKQIYFAFTATTDLTTKIMVYDLSTKKLKLSTSDLISDTLFDTYHCGSSLTYNPITRKLQYIFLSSSGSITYRWLGRVIYEKYGDSFRLVDSLKIASDIIRTFHRIAASWTDSSGTTYLVLVNVNISKYFIIKF